MVEAYHTIFAELDSFHFIIKVAHSRYLDPKFYY